MSDGTEKTVAGTQATPVVIADKWGLGPDGWPAVPELVQPFRRADGVPKGKTARKRHWRKTEILTFGERLLDECDPERTILSFEQHRKICALQDADAVAALLSSDFGNAKQPDLAKASEVFGILAAHELNVPHVILVLRFQTVAQLLDVWADARAIYKDQRYTREERLDALKCAKEAAVEKNKVVNLIERMAVKLKLVEEQDITGVVAPFPEPPKPKAVGSAPELE